MRYQFRDTFYQGKTVRHIKALAVDSYGDRIGPTDQLHVIRRYIERTQLDTVVVVMTGQGRTLTTRDPFMQAFDQAHPILVDACYVWQETNFLNP